MTRCGCSNPGVLGCTCTLVDSNCVDVTGAGSAASPYSLAPILSVAAGQLLTCGSGGLKAIVGDIPVAGKFRRSTNQTITTATDTAIQWDATAWVSTRALTLTGGPPTTRVTDPAGGAGKFIFYASTTFGIHGSGLVRAQLRKNGTTILSEECLPGTGYVYHDLSAVVDLAATDYMELIVHQTSGSSKTCTATIAGVGMLRR